MKREVPLIICFISGFVMLVQYYSPRMDWMTDTLLAWFNIITVFAFILGVASLLSVNGGKIARLQPGWGYNAVLIVSFLVTLVVGLWKGTDNGTPLSWIFTYVFGALQSTMYSLLAFFIASAAFRAFKAKTVEATLLLVTAFIVMFGQAPLGELIWNGLGLNQLLPIDRLINYWILGGFNTAGQRAILLGAAVGVISVGMKIILGIERTYMGGD